MRLDPLSIPYRAVEGSLQFVVGIVVFGVAGSGSVGGAEGLALFGALAVVGIGAALGWQVAYYRRFEYHLTDDTFDIDSGVLSRREREIPYGRIQNVDIAQNVIQRVLGIAEVRLETAGGGESEAQLRYVSREEATRLQEAISRRKRGDGTESEGAAEAGDPEATPLFEITPRELAVLGVVSMDPRLLSLLALPLSFVGPSVLSDLLPSSTGPLWLLLPLALVGVLVATAAVSGVLAIARYYDFRLTETGGEFRYERGLLQRYSGSIPKSKVQTLSVTENVVARRLGYASLTIETAGHVATDGDGGGSQSAIPIAERDRVADLVRRIEPVEELTFERPPERARRRYAGRYAIALGVVTTVAYGVVALTDLSGPWWALLALAPLVPVAAHLTWRHRGYHVESGHVVTRNGFWSRRIAVVPAYRIQTVASSATVFQRRWGLATVAIDTAGSHRLSGSDPKAVDIDAETAERLRERLADDLQTALTTDRARRAERRDLDTAT